MRITGDRKRREAHGWSGKSVVPNAQGPRDRRILRGGGEAPDHLPTTEEYAKAVFYRPGRRCRRKNDTVPHRKGGRHLRRMRYYL